MDWILLHQVGTIKVHLTTDIVYFLRNCCFQRWKCSVNITRCI